MSFLPEAFSSYAGDLDWLIKLISQFVIGWFFVALIALLYGIFANLKKEGGKAKYIPGIGFDQTKWILIPTILVVMSDFTIDWATHKVWAQIEYEENFPTENAVEVKVIGRQFEWNFQYAGADGKLGTADDEDGAVVNVQKPGIDKEMDTDDDKYINTGVLVVPVNRNIILNLTAADVLHSFFVKEWRFKQDVIPGRIITRYVVPTEEGVYDVICAEICGMSHGYMRGRVAVVSEDEYNAFLQDKQGYVESKLMDSL